MGNSLVRGCRSSAEDDEDCEDWREEEDEEELTMPEPLTEEDKARLRQTWKALESDPAAVGIIMFTRLVSSQEPRQVRRFLGESVLGCQSSWSRHSSITLVARCTR